jgi:hydrogenase expression/formation protein HypC
MCLAIPMQVTEIDGDFGTVELDGISYKAGLQLLKSVKVGDYVIVHAGFAIQKVDEKEAEEIYELFKPLRDEKTGGGDV